MGWFALDIVGLRRSNTDGASAALFALGAVGVQESWMEGTAPPPRQPWDHGSTGPLPKRHVLTAWFEQEHRAAAAQALSPWLDAETELVWRVEEERDWEAESRAGFKPIIAGGFVIAPPWDAPEGSLLVEPGAGFGTGDHPTTRQALLILDGLTDASAMTGRTALDIGCGSGVLALAAASRGMDAHGIDIEDTAVANARHNAELNGLRATFDARAPDALTPADVVLANLHAELLVHFADDLMRLTRHHLVVAGVLADREHLVRAAIPWPIAQRLVDGEWIALELPAPGMKRIRVDVLPHDGPLDASASHHLLHVMRARPGVPLLLFDGAGHEQPAELVRSEGSLAIARATGPVRTVEARAAVDLVVAVLKHQAMDLALRMATEAGVRNVYPALTERTVAKGERLDRWERIVSSAAAQCGRADVPTIHPIAPLRDAVEGLELPVYAALPGGAHVPRPTEPCAVCIGPEGDFSPTEATWLSSRATPVGLGPHILRAETACVVAVALLLPER